MRQLPQGIRPAPAAACSDAHGPHLPGEQPEHVLGRDPLLHLQVERLAVGVADDAVRVREVAEVPLARDVDEAVDIPAVDPADHSRTAAEAVWRQEDPAEQEVPAHGRRLDEEPIMLPAVVEADRRFLDVSRIHQAGNVAPGVQDQGGLVHPRNVNRILFELMVVIQLVEHLVSFLCVGFTHQTLVTLSSHYTTLCQINQ